MRDDLLYYYERELAYLRRTGAEFARRYPKVASRLMLEPTKCDDPHVERLLEGFAFLAARVHLRIDDDFPQVSEALLNVVYPHYVRPIPSMALVQFHLDREQGKLTSGLRVPKETVLFSRPVGGVRCQFATSYDTWLWPVNVEAAKWSAPHELVPPVRRTDAAGALRVVLRCLPDVTFAELEIDRLRMHLSAESNLASTLYEVLCNNCTQILLRDATPGSKKEPIVLPRSALRPVGFAEDEGMLPYPRRSFLGYRLLQEYFTFPDKFFFLDLEGLGKLRAAGFGDAVEIVFLTSAFEQNQRRATLETGVNAETIRLGCTPIINLFEKTSEPIQLTHRQQDYLLVADARRKSAVGIFSVDDVVAIKPGATEPTRFEPFYSFRHGSNIDDRLFWTASRRPATWRADEGTDVFLSFVDGNARTMQPDVDAVTARLHCFDGNLPSRLPFGDPQGDFEMPGGGPVEKIITLVKPTPVIDPPLGKPQLWRLISQLSLNYVSLTEGGVETLREVLRLHNFGETTSGERQIQGLLSVEGKPVFSRIENRHGLTFARGQRVEVEFDEDQFAGGGVYLFASVLERFLGLYVSLNSFCILAVRTRQRRELMREWPPRAGWKALL